MRTLPMVILAALLALPAGCRNGAGMAAPTVTHVWVVFKSHYDIGYNRTVADVLKHYRTTQVDTALATVEQTGQGPRELRFAWTIPGWPLTRMLDEQQRSAQRLSNLLLRFPGGDPGARCAPREPDREQTRSGEA